MTDRDLWLLIADAFEGETVVIGTYRTQESARSEKKILESEEPQWENIEVKHITIPSAIEWLVK